MGGWQGYFLANQLCREVAPKGRTPGGNCARVGMFATRHGSVGACAGLGQVLPGDGAELHLYGQARLE